MNSKSGDYSNSVEDFLLDQGWETSFSTIEQGIYLIQAKKQENGKNRHMITMVIDNPKSDIESNYIKHLVKIGRDNDPHKLSIASKFEIDGDTRELVNKHNIEIIDIGESKGNSSRVLDKNSGESRIYFDQIKQIVGFFTIAGVGLGLTGSVTMSQVGSGGIFGGTLMLIILVFAFLIGPILALITCFHISNNKIITRKLYFVGLIGSMSGYFIMMVIVLLILSSTLAIIVGDGASGSTAAQSASSSGTSLPIGEYIVPIITVSIPAGITGVGGIYFGGSEKTTNKKELADVPLLNNLSLKYVGIALAVVTLLITSMVVVPGLLSSASAQQLEVTGDVSTAQNQVYAGGTVSNPTDSRISTPITVEFVVDGDVITTKQEKITVLANDETNLNIQVASASDLTESNLEAFNDGQWYFRYYINDERVTTYPPVTGQT